jgi:signal transduction histidine kinase/CheY-like chemotaxis protein
VKGRGRQNEDGKVVSKMARVLIADDEPDLIEDYHCALSRFEPGNPDARLAELQDELFGPQQSNGSLPQVELVAVNQGDAAVREISLARSESRPFSVAFLDVRMPPGMSGLDAAMKIREIDADLPIVIVTAYTDVQMIDLAKKVPPADRLFVLQKPFHTTEIQQLTIALTARWELDRLKASGNPGVAEHELRHLQDLLGNLPGGVAVYDERERLVHKNGEIEALFPNMKDSFRTGAAYATLRDNLAELLLPERVLKRPMQANTEGGGRIVAQGGTAIRRVAGNRWMMIAERAQPSGGSVVQFLDITAMKVAEQRRMINGTMTHLSRFAEELLNRLEPAKRGGALRLDPVAEGDDSDVTQRLQQDLTPVAQRLQLTPRATMLDALINEVVAQLVPGLPLSITLETVSSIGLWPVFVDPAQVKQALRALIDNAVEASGRDGRVYVESMNVRATRDALPEMPGLRSGDYVCIRVTDNGSGMASEVIDRAFMPYFTTKDTQDHRGMGLTTAFSIVNQSGGFLYIDSDGQSETQVRLFFPRAPIAAPGKSAAIRH